MKGTASRPNSSFPTQQKWDLRVSQPSLGELPTTLMPCSSSSIICYVLFLPKTQLLEEGDKGKYFLTEYIKYSFFHFDVFLSTKAVLLGAVQGGTSGNNADSRVRRGKTRSSQALTFSLGAVVDLAVLLGDGVGVGRRQQVLGGAGHPVLTLVMGAQVGGGRKDPAVTAEGAVIRGHFLSHCAPGNNWVLLTASKETKEKQISKAIN